MRLLRIVPDDTKFDFMRFRRISFPISAAMSILAISLYFFHGLNFGIDFKGGTLIEIQTKGGQAADLGKMRSTLSALGLGEVQLQQFGAPDDVLIRIAEQPGGDAAQQVAVTKVRARSATRSIIAASRWSARAYRVNYCHTASSAWCWRFSAF